MVFLEIFSFFLGTKTSESVLRRSQRFLETDFYDLFSQ